MAKKAKITIWSNSDINEDDWKEDYQEYLELNELTEDDCSLNEFIDDSNNRWFDDERDYNLNRNIEGNVIAIVDLELWDGHHKAYKLINKKNLNAIFNLKYHTTAEIYCDKYNVCANIWHHDGCNHVLFRMVKPGVNIDRLCKKIYNEEEITSNMLCKYTKSLRPYVKEICGFE